MIALITRIVHYYNYESVSTGVRKMNITVRASHSIICMYQPGVVSPGLHALLYYYIIYLQNPSSKNHLCVCGCVRIR